MIDKKVIASLVAQNKKQLKFRVIPTNDVDFELVEFEPHVRTLISNNGFRKNLIKLQLPYVQYAKYTGITNNPPFGSSKKDVLTGFYMSFTNQPIESVRDSGTIPPLLGCGYNQLLVCLQYNLSPRNIGLDGLINNFWDSYGEVTNILFYSKWRKITLSGNSSQEILKVDWKSMRQSFSFERIPENFRIFGVPH